MSLFKKIIVFIIFVILFYILFRLVKKRTEILQVMNQESPVREGISCISEIKNASVKKILDSNPVSEITDSLSSKKYFANDDPLHKFHIKASYHSAFNGTDISKDMVLYILSRGYRYLDFEIYYDLVSGEKSETKKAVVSYKSESVTANVNVALKDILDIINLNAFSNVNNKDDPLFIQLRPIYNKQLDTDTIDNINKKIGNNNQLNTQIQQALTVLTNKYNGPVNSDTPIKQLLKKIIIVMDNTKNADIQTKGPKLIEMININFIDSMMTLCNAESKLEDCNPQNTTTLIQVNPLDSNNKILTQNPEALNVISKTPCNICPMMAWMSSNIGGVSYLGLSQLGEYETMFLKTGGSAFVLLSEAKTYSTNNNPLNIQGTQFP